MSWSPGRDHLAAEQIRPAVRVASGSRARAARGRGARASTGSFSVSTRWNSSVAVEPSTRFASPGSCTPGSCDEDAVEALALHDGFRDAELVDAVAQRERVLLDREVLALAQRGLASSFTMKPERPSTCAGSIVKPARELAELDQLIAGVEPANDLLGAGEIAGLDDRTWSPSFTTRRSLRMFAVAQLRAQVGLVRREVLVESRKRGRPGRGSALRRAGRGRAPSASGRRPAGTSACASASVNATTLFGSAFAKNFVAAQLIAGRLEADHRSLVVERERR